MPSPMLDMSSSFGEERMRPSEVGTCQAHDPVTLNAPKMSDEGGRSDSPNSGPSEPAGINR